MEKQKRVDKAATLGAYLRDLRPGSACICCGSALQWADGADETRSKEWKRARTEEGPSLTCPDCGCEIDGVSAANRSTETHRDLNRAA